MSENDVKTLHSSSNLYPILLKETQDHPKTLYYLSKNTINSDSFQNCLGIVGSRALSSYGRELVDFFVPDLVNSGIKIVSGFAYGVDFEVQKLAIDLGGSVITVLPGGLAMVERSQYTNLLENQLNNNGLVISEYKYDQTPRKWTFARRNRIIAGLCSYTLVIEAGVRSGTLITAKNCFKFNRGVLVPPGNIFSQNYGGVKELLKSGAKIIISSEDIISMYKEFTQDGTNAKPVKKLKHNDIETYDVVTKNVFNYLCTRSSSFEDLILLTKLDPSELITALSYLEVLGKVTQIRGRYYAN